MKTLPLSYRLSEFESEIVAVLQLNPWQEARDIARAIKLRTENVQYVIRKLRDRAKLQIRPFVDLYRLTPLHVAMYVTTGIRSHKQFEALLKELRSHRLVTWCSELIGDFHLGFTLYAKSMHEVQDFLERISLRYESAFLDRAIAPRVRYRLFPRKYLSPKKYDYTPLNLGLNPEPFHIDSLNGKLLFALSNSTFTSIREVARELGEPYSTISRRVSALSDEKLIVGYFVWLPPQCLGVTPNRVFLASRGLLPDDRSWILRYTQLHPRVVSLSETLGVFDYEIGLEVQTPEQTAEFIRSLYEHLGPKLQAVKTVVETRQIRWTSFPGSVSS
jgi:DNA-binding Lrp family transcriptional regulator